MSLSCLEGVSVLFVFFCHLSSYCYCKFVANALRTFKSSEPTRLFCGVHEEVIKKKQVKCEMIQIENVGSPCGEAQFQYTYRGCYFSKSDLHRYNQRVFADRRSSVFRSI